MWFINFIMLYNAIKLKFIEKPERIDAQNPYLQQLVSSDSVAQQDIPGGS